MKGSKSRHRQFEELRAEGVSFVPARFCRWRLSEILRKSCGATHGLKSLRLCMHTHDERRRSPLGHAYDCTSGRMGGQLQAAGEAIEMGFIRRDLELAGVLHRGIDLIGRMCNCVGAMTATVQKIAEQVKALPEKELDEFLSWLAEYELEHADQWDEELARDSQPGGRLDAVLKRVRDDIAAGRTKPLDEVIDNS